MREIEKWRRFYVQFADLAVHKDRVARSRAVTERFLSDHPKSYVGWSAGKDSTAMLHLVWMLCPGIRVMTEKDDMDFPEELCYVRMMLKKYNLNLDVISPDISLWDVVKEYDITEDIHSRGTDFSERYFYGLIAAYKRTHSMEGVFLGLRAEESKGRRANRKTRGLTYQKNDGEWICQPIVDWSGKDVFAYLFSHNVPILPVYFKTKFVKCPEDIRKSWILPSAQTSQGGALWLKYYYPEIFARLARIKPELREYT